MKPENLFTNKAVASLQVGHLLDLAGVAFVHVVYAVLGAAHNAGGPVGNCAGGAGVACQGLNAWEWSPEPIVADCMSALCPCTSRNSMISRLHPGHTFASFLQQETMPHSIDAARHA